MKKAILYDLEKAKEFILFTMWTQPNLTPKQQVIEGIDNYKRSVEYIYNYEAATIPAPIIAAFCTLISNSGIVEQTEDVSIDTYCKNVCRIYKLNATKRTRQYFGNAFLSNSRINQVRKRIFPFIDEQVVKKIEESRKLYG